MCFVWDLTKESGVEKEVRDVRGRAEPWGRRCGFKCAEFVVEDWEWEWEWDCGREGDGDGDGDGGVVNGIPFPDPRYGIESMETCLLVPSRARTRMVLSSANFTSRAVRGDIERV